MADKSSQLVLDALSRAAADPAGVPLFQQKTTAGLFSGAALARKAAQRCKEEDLLRVIHTETHGKNVRELVTITPKGLEHLLHEVSPRQVLQDLVRAVEARQKQMADLTEVTRQTQSSLAGIERLAATVLQQIDNNSPTCSPPPLGVDHATTLVKYLEKWATATASEDCPLPRLYQETTGLTIGQFHDVLRRLHTEQRIYLHPWTGPLCELPEPPLALLVGHEIAYYASAR